MQFSDVLDAFALDAFILGFILLVTTVVFKCAYMLKFED